MICCTSTRWIIIRCTDYSHPILLGTQEGQPGAGQEDGLLINHKMRAGSLLIAIMLAVVQAQCSAFVFKASSALIPRRSHKLFSQLNPQPFRTAEEMRDSQCGVDEMVYSVALDMAANVKELKISEKLLPHLALPLSTQLLDGLDFCLPVLEQVEYITSFFANYDSVTLALLAVVLHVKFELHDAGQRLTLSPSDFRTRNLQRIKKLSATRCPSGLIRLISPSYIPSW